MKKYFTLAIQALMTVALTSGSSLRTSGQIISTIAGNGRAGFSGDGGPATAGEMYGVWGIATDADGNIYAADAGNNRIRKINRATGIITTVAGGGVYGMYPDSIGDGGPADSAYLNSPTGVVVDACGNIYIADRGDDVIRRVDALTGIITTYAGWFNGPPILFGGDGGPADSAFLNQPQSVALDNAGNLYICDYSNRRVRKVDAVTGIITTVAGNGGAMYAGDGGPADSAQINAPWGVAVDGNNNIFIADNFEYVVRRVDGATGIITTYAGNGNPAFNGFSGIGGPAGSASIYALGVAVDACNNVYIAADVYVFKVDAATQIISAVAGNDTAGYSGDGGLATNAEIRQVFSVAFNRTGTMYVSDDYWNVIRMVTDTNSCCLPVVTIQPDADTICSQSAVSFTAIVSNAGNAPSYQWKVNGTDAGNNTDTFTISSFASNAIVNCLVTGNAACNPGAAVYSNNIVVIASLPVDTNISDTICYGESYVFNGMQLTQSGSYTDTLTSVAGCDSIVTLILTVNPVVVTDTSVSITCGDSLNFGGIFYHLPGSYNDTLTAVSGCDSIVTLQLAVTGGDTINQFGGICAGDSINFYGIWIYSPGMYQTTLPGTPCDTTAILSLVVMDPIPPTRVSDTICANDILLFNGIYEHAAGTYTAHYSSVNGCDSTVDLTLTVQPASQTVTPASIVCGDSIYFGGSYYHLSGTYGDTATNIDGCDSITTLQLTVTGGDTTYLNDTICSNDSLLFNGSYYNTGGTYTAQYNSVTNCDSTVILHLMVNQVYNTDTAVTISCGDSVSLGGIFYHLSDSYSDTLNTINGCDSVITLQLTVIGGDTTYLNDTICANDSVLFNGGYYNVGGIYTAQYVSVTSCDSTVILELTVNAVYTTQIYDTICANDSLWFIGIYLDTAGTYAWRLNSVAGCDSIVLLQLAVNPVVTFTWDSLIAAGDILPEPNWELYYAWGYDCGLPNVFALSGGSPAGGHYSGRYISDDTMTINGAPIGGFDTITYTVSDSNRCNGSVNAVLQFTICEAIQTITPNNLFDLYPNPAGDYTMIAINPSAIGSSMKLMDVTGKELMSMKLTATPQRIPISTLAAGVYMVAVETKGVTGVKLLVKTE